MRLKLNVWSRMPQLRWASSYNKCLHIGHDSTTNRTQIQFHYDCTHTSRLACYHGLDVRCWYAKHLRTASISVLKAVGCPIRIVGSLDGQLWLVVACCVRTSGSLLHLEQSGRKLFIRNMCRIVTGFLGDVGSYTRRTRTLISQDAKRKANIQSIGNTETLARGSHCFACLSSSTADGITFRRAAARGGTLTLPLPTATTLTAALLAMTTRQYRSAPTAAAAATPKLGRRGLRVASPAAVMRRMLTVVASRCKIAASTTATAALSLNGSARATTTTYARLRLS